MFGLFKIFIFEKPFYTQSLFCKVQVAFAARNIFCHWSQLLQHPDTPKDQRGTRFGTRQNPPI